jgi:hypothetical protein
MVLGLFARERRHSNEVSFTEREGTQMAGAALVSGIPFCRSLAGPCESGVPPAVRPLPLD